MPPQYELKRSKRKTISLLITRDAQVVVRAPLHMPRTAIDAFVLEHHHWLDKHLPIIKKRAQERREFQCAPGDSLPVLGIPRTVELADNPKAALVGERLLLPRDSGDNVKTAKEFLRRLAEETIPPRVEALAAAMGLSYHGVSITWARSRWGSCSGKNKLCFSYRLACLPPELADAVIVHELAHILVKNHSAAFYGVVHQAMPDYPARNTQLRQWAKALLL